ncbi:hypothetical protein N0V90_010164 [Kalmusia sp. IMI 367209]|nr:hypothetical protein N0V90_010164 [Kalmusia sp. IMI 367209]
MSTASNFDPNIQAAYSKSRHKRAFGAAVTGFSALLTPVMPIMAVPTVVAAYKTHKHHKNKRLLESEHPELKKPSDQDKFNANVRQVTRHISRGSIGLVSASVLAPVLPHIVLPAGINVYILHRAEKDRKELAQQMNGRGLRIRKRDVARGLGRVMLEKSDSHPDHAGDTGLLHEALVDTSGIQDFNEVVNAPVEAIQEALGIETAEERLEDIQNYNLDAGGWHEDAGLLASNVVITGSAAAAVEWVVDRPLEYRDGKLQELPPGENYVKR